jgi:hypothetical protein
MLKFGLFKSPLTSGADDHRAVIQELKMNDEKDLLKEIIVPGGVTAVQAMAVLTAWNEVIEKKLRSGEGVKTKLVEIKPSVRGVFDGEDDIFNPKQHFVVLIALARKKLQEIGKELKVQKVAVRERVPIPYRFTDTTTRRHNEVISAGGVGQLEGRFLKCDTDDNEQGVFILQPDGSTLPISSFIHNTGTKLVFFIPEGLTIGDEVVLEVRNKLDNRIKELRKSRLPRSFSVV